MLAARLSEHANDFTTKELQQFGDAHDVKLKGKKAAVVAAFQELLVSVGWT